VHRTSRVYDRHPSPDVWAPSTEAGGDLFYGTAAIGEGSTRVVRCYSLEILIGKTRSLRLAVPDAAYRLRAPYHCTSPGSKRNLFLFAWRAVLWLSYRAVLRPHSEGLGTLERTAPAANPPDDLANCSDADSHYSHRRVDGSVWVSFGMWRTRGWNPRILRKPWILAGGSQGEGQHIRARAQDGSVDPEGFHTALRPAQKRVVRLYTDKMIVVFVIKKWVSTSPASMAELRRLHRLSSRHGLALDMHHRPSAPNLYADLLARRRRVADYPPTL
jgi:hypothetical protein